MCIFLCIMVSLHGAVPLAAPLSSGGYFLGGVLISRERIPSSDESTSNCRARRTKVMHHESTSCKLEKARVAHGAGKRTEDTKVEQSDALIPRKWVWYLLTHFRDIYAPHQCCCCACLRTPHRTVAWFRRHQSGANEPSLIYYRYRPVETNNWRLSTRESVPCRLADHEIVLEARLKHTTVMAAML